MSKSNMGILLALIAAASLAACSGSGGGATGSSIPSIVATNTPTPATSTHPSVTSTPTPTAARSSTPTSAPTAVGSTNPTSAPTASSTATPAPTATPSPSSTALTGVWQYGNVAGFWTQQGSLPNIALTNVSTGVLMITVNNTGDVALSGSTCPSMIPNFPDPGVPVSDYTFELSRAYLTCQFTITDYGSGKSVFVNYTNT